MKFHGQLEWTDYLAAQYLHMRPPPIARGILFVLYAFLGLMFVVALVFGLLGRLDILVLFPLLAFGAFFALFRYVLLPRRLRQLFTQQKELSLPIDYEITEAGLTVSNGLGSSLRPWKHFIKWKEDKDILMLYHSDAAFTMLPKRFFTDPEQIERVKAHLVQDQVPIAKSRDWWINPLVYLILLIAMGWIIYINITYGGN